jgi:hypothetical protein
MRKRGPARCLPAHLALGWPIACSYREKSGKTKEAGEDATPTVILRVKESRWGQTKPQLGKKRE